MGGHGHAAPPPEVIVYILSATYILSIASDCRFLFFVVCCLPLDNRVASRY